MCTRYFSSVIRACVLMALAVVVLLGLASEGPGLTGQVLALAAGYTAMKLVRLWKDDPLIKIYLRAAGPTGDNE